MSLFLQPPSSSTSWKFSHIFCLFRWSEKRVFNSLSSIKLIWLNFDNVDETVWELPEGKKLGGRLCYDQLYKKKRKNGNFPLDFNEMLLERWNLWFGFDMLNVRNTSIMLSTSTLSRDDWMEQTQVDMWNKMKKGKWKAFKQVNGRWWKGFSLNEVC